MFEVVGEGVVAEQPPSLTCCHARSVELPDDGEIVACFATNSGVGTNNFETKLVRSRDGGSTWSEPRSIFPHLHEAWSIAGSLSAAPDGSYLVLYGEKFPRSQTDPDESFYKPEIAGMKGNQAFFSVSRNRGSTWSEPADVPRRFGGAVEAACAMLITDDGTWLAGMCPHRAWDPDEQLDLGRLLCQRSVTQGASWEEVEVMRFAEDGAGSANPALCQLANGSVVATCWQTAFDGETRYPIPYAVSNDDGVSFEPAGSTGLLGQAHGTAGARGGDATALMVYNQRQEREPGVRLAVATPSPEGFGLRGDMMVWQAANATQSGTSGEIVEWTDFAFGEPSVLACSGEAGLLVLFWYGCPTPGLLCWCKAD